jgi:hypothetical protein
MQSTASVIINVQPNAIRWQKQELRSKMALETEKPAAGGKTAAPGSRQANADQASVLFFST